MKTYKRWLFLMLALALCLCILSITPALAAGDDFTIENNVLTAYNGAGGNVIIPDGVTKIGSRAFYSCENLTGITIPNSVTEIDADAFGWCKQLSSVALSNGLIKIGTRSFYGCVSLSNIVIPNSVTEIGECAFQYCSNLTRVELGDGVTKIGRSAFSSCENINSITLPDGILTIGPYAFNGCHLTSIMIPGSTSEIGDGAFSCSTLTSVTVSPNNVHYASTDGILFNKATTKLLAYPAGRSAAAYTIPSKVIEIGADAFDYCSSLTSITIPKNVERIGYGAFSQCTGLTSITIPDSVTEIGAYAFSGCTSLTSITLPAGITELSDWMFSWCSSLTSITIPSNITKIGNYTFSQCDSLTSITIPANVVKIGKNVFQKCDALTIYGAAYSRAHSYACKNEIPFSAQLAAVSINIPPIPKELAGFCTQEEWEVLAWANQERLDENLSPLSIFPTLQRAADIREQELTSTYSHTRPDGGEFYTVLETVGLSYSTAGENIASGQASAARVAFAWMNSKGHRENILTGDYKHIGIGFSRSGGLYGTSWVQLFLNNHCSISKITLSQDSVVCSAGSGINELGVYVLAECPVHGTCYLPLISEMCADFNGFIAGEQTITVTYGGQTAQLQVWCNPFTDVAKNAYYFAPVQWAVRCGITNGTSDDTFSPNATCTQAQIITFLYRAVGEPAVTNENPYTYETVTADKYYYSAMLWAYQNGVITDTGINPNDGCSRSDAVTYLWRLEGRSIVNGGGFTDVPLSADYAQAVAWAIQQGITTGTSNATFSPNDICTRSQIVTFLYRDMV